MQVQGAVAPPTDILCVVGPPTPCLTGERPTSIPPLAHMASSSAPDATQCGWCWHGDRCPWLWAGTCRHGHTRAQVTAASELRDASSACPWADSRILRCVGNVAGTNDSQSFGGTSTAEHGHGQQSEHHDCENKDAAGKLQTGDAQLRDITAAVIDLQDAKNQQSNYLTELKRWQADVDEHMKAHRLIPHELLMLQQRLDAAQGETARSVEAHRLTHMVQDLTGMVKDCPTNAEYNCRGEFRD